MPTSSQALILHTQPQGRSTESVFRTQSLLLKEPAPCAVASIYDLSGCIPLSTKSIDEGNAVRLLGKESAQLFKYHPLPVGYTSILAYDSIRDKFKWQVLGGAAVINESHTSVTVDREEEQNGGKSSSGYVAAKRPASTMEIFRRNDAGQITVTNIKMYERLIGLGFRKSDLVVKDVDGKSQLQTGRRHAPETETNVVKVPLIGMERSDTARRPTPATSVTETNELHALPRSTASKKVVIKEADSLYDVNWDELDYEHADEYNRIKPSIFMVKYTPKSRPTAAILSLRENECSFHAEVKFLIETQTDTCVKSVQYDPLHIRSGKPDIRSRWIVDFNTVTDLEKVVKKGLVIGKDKIIIYKFDDIMRREVSAFKYFKAIMDANKKFKGSKSNSVSGKSTSISSSGKQHKKALRSTKSAH